MFFINKLTVCTSIICCGVVPVAATNSYQRSGGKEWARSGYIFACKSNTQK